MKKIENFQIAFYDKNGCYDEGFFDPQDTFIFGYLFNEDYTCPDEYCRLFANFNDGSSYEIKLVRNEEYVCRN